MRILFYKISKTFKQITLKLFFDAQKVAKLRFTGKLLVKRSFTKLYVYSRFTVIFREKTVNRYMEIEIFSKIIYEKTSSHL
jgi:hypothetical protein